jgi:2-polyprenyl-6-methoxyphenol hydroxylase-like FAD-dependent oxidoreductase
MADAVVIGAGVGGMTTALLLARDGHRVRVLERDPAPPPADPDEAWAEWERRGVNQFRLPHFLLSKWRQVAERELPELVAALEARGARRLNMLTELPNERIGGVRPEDAVFDTVTARRPVIEAALDAVASSTDGLTIHRGVAVTGLVTGPSVVTGVPHVIGVATADGERITADLVVDTGGRRSALPAWLAAIGARPTIEEAEDCGFVYYGRHYRAVNGHVPQVVGPPLQDYESVSILTLPSDNATWSVTFVTSARDKELRGLRHADRFEAAVARYPMVAHWLDGVPISGVDVMAKIEDRYRRLVVEGEPVATGVVAVADAWACTNPSLGRGASFALLHAVALRDLLREVPAEEPGKVVERWDETTEANLTPLYRDTLGYDQYRLAEIESLARGEAHDDSDPVAAIRRALRIATPHDPEIIRARFRIGMFLGSPSEVLAEPGLLERVIQVAEGRPEWPFPGPTRADLVATARG